MTKAETSIAVPPPASLHEVSAADYDPSVDRKVDEAREQQQQQRDAAPPATEVEVDEEDDIDDMFSLDTEAGEKPKKKKTIRVKKTKNGVALPDATAAGGPAHAGLTSNWDDDEGYYRIVLGERIGPKGRFHVFANLGKGMFSEVVRAKDLGEDGKGSGDSTPDVAIKIVRSQETMYKAGIKEIAHLQKLARLDVDDKRHVVRLVSHFTHRGHLCMVFENLAMNLREVVKRFGKDVGLNLKAVKAYAHQMLLGLALFRKAGIVHADLKPDNVLVNEAKTTLKICDLGSAVDVNEMDLTPYLVSRFYRAPEVILGLPCDASIDTWAVGCTLYELYTGRILFPGRSNNQMLHLIQETKGKVPTKLIRKGQFAHLHFDETNTFLAHAAPTAANSARVVLPTSPVNGQDLKSRLASPQVLRGLDEQEARRTQAFVELLGRMLEVDPAKRITPQEALRHAFLAA
ncbi:kinase-like protein [Jaminaea rosea]|uniref:non-specific serine/threonine protein kinase n=1 Tax=Jaminaea rosea TaxID=1569628 RepID=A0A316USS2_9BASI|nr:kinase-like protein [Jaminaea rosea]PWN28337.1 kinase-like protein [Jaminaea rosea]